MPAAITRLSAPVDGANYIPHPDLPRAASSIGANGTLTISTNGMAAGTAQVERKA